MLVGNWRVVVAEIPNDAFGVAGLTSAEGIIFPFFLTPHRLRSVVVAVYQGRNHDVEVVLPSAVPATKSNEAVRVRGRNRFHVPAAIADAAPSPLAVHDDRPFGDVAAFAVASSFKALQASAILTELWQLPPR
jgi:hypothetical protein